MFYWLTKVLFPRACLTTCIVCQSALYFSFSIYHTNRPVEHLVYLIALMLLLYCSKLLLQ